MSPFSRHNRGVNVRWIQPGATLGAQRGDVVVCIPVYGGHEHFVGCLRSVLAHTPSEVPILICDDASPDPRSRDFVRKAGGRRGLGSTTCTTSGASATSGFRRTSTAAFEMAAPADVVVAQFGRRRRRGVARRPARRRLHRQPRGDGDRADKPRQPRLGAGPTAGGAVASGVESRRRQRRRAGALAETPPAASDRDRALHLRPPQRARARRRVRPRVHSRIRGGGRLLPALRPQRAEPRARGRRARAPSRRRQLQPQRQAQPAAGRAREDHRHALPVLPRQRSHARGRRRRSAVPRPERRPACAQGALAGHRRPRARGSDDRDAAPRARAGRRLVTDGAGPDPGRSSPTRSRATPGRRFTRFPRSSGSRDGRPSTADSTSPTSSIVPTRSPTTRISRSWRSSASG